MDDRSQPIGLEAAKVQTSSPKELASAVHSELLRRLSNPPPLEMLVELFDSMYFASLKTEESKPVLFHVVYIDPERPDPKPPETLVHNRWRCIQLFPSIALTSANFSKLAPASDP